MPLPTTREASRSAHGLPRFPRPRALTNHLSHRERLQRVEERLETGREDDHEQIRHCCVVSGHRPATGSVCGQLQGRPTSTHSIQSAGADPPWRQVATSSARARGSAAEESIRSAPSQ